MRKMLTVFSIIVLSVMLEGCSKTANNEQEMLEIIKSTAKLSESPVSIGNVIEGDKYILIAMTANEDDPKTYYAAEFTVEDQKYKYISQPKLYERGADIYSLPTTEGYLFISNNPETKTLQLRFPNDETKNTMIPIEQIPFVYYLNLTDDNNRNFEYDFIDGNGNNVIFPVE